MINTFSRYYKKKYGKGVGKIALSTRLPCPNRLAGGCTFCAPSSFEPFYLKNATTIADQLAQGKSYLKTRKYRLFFAYFQQETTTAAPIADLMEYFSLALSERDCIGLIISTRPDYVDDRLLDSLARLAEKKEIIFELGLQSIHDRTLEQLNRNHTFADFINAAERIRKHRSLQLGAHLILGLPDEDLEDMTKTIVQVARIGVQHLKLHHLQVIKGTKLHESFCKTGFKTYEGEEYIELLLYLLPYIKNTIVLHRLWSSSPQDILIAPRWQPSNRELREVLHSAMTKRNVVQGSCYSV